jgi:hypothetical protein
LGSQILHERFELPYSIALQQSSKIPAQVGVIEIRRGRRRVPMTLKYPLECPATVMVGKGSISFPFSGTLAH